MPESAEPGLLDTDLVLLLLLPTNPNEASTGGVDGITRMEKILYLADRETAIRENVVQPFEFVPYNYGPYSKGVYDAIEFLENIGLVQETRRYMGEPIDEVEEATATSSELEGVERSFRLTPKGEAVAQLLAKKYQRVAGDLTRVKKHYGQMPLAQLIRYVYTRYPESAENSIIRDRVF